MDSRLHRPGAAVRDGNIGQRVDEMRWNMRREQDASGTIPTQPWQDSVVAMTD
jgi:hypothetical protein